MKIRLNHILLLLFILPGFLRLSAQNWTAPEEAREVVAPFLFTPESVKAGETLYTKNCQSCHGAIGKNMPAPIIPKPEDPAIAKFQAQKDGEIFWKITNGKAPMPTFRNVLSDEEKWDVISYIRSFNPGYNQPAPVSAANFKGKILQLSMTGDTVTNKVTVTAMEVLPDKKLIPFKGAEIQLSVTRIFGKLKVGESHKSNASGIAVFDFPKDLPGDKTGLVEVTASVTQEGIMTRPVKSMLKIGKPLLIASLDIKGKMWSRKGEAPVWLNSTFLIALITAWGFILYVIYKILKMSRIGNKKNDLDLLA